MKKAPAKKQSNLTPKEIFDSIAAAPALTQGEFFDQHFKGLHIRAHGIVQRMYDLHPTPASVVEIQNDVEVAAAFEKPVSPELISLKLGDSIEISGTVSFYSYKRIALEECVLLSRHAAKPTLSREGSPMTASEKSGLPTPSPGVDNPLGQKQWTEKWYGNLSIQVIAGLIVGILILIISALYLKK